MEPREITLTKEQVADLLKWANPDYENDYLGRNIYDEGAIWRNGRKASDALDWIKELIEGAIYDANWADEEKQAT
jgi:hypothetical protein